VVNRSFISTLQALSWPFKILAAALNGYCPRLLLAPVRDEKVLAENICKILEDPSLGTRLSKNGRNRAEACDWSIVVPRWERLIRETCEQVL